jgi:DNA repair protein RadC
MAPAALCEAARFYGKGLAMAISEWPPEERPRERLYALGACALSDAELLALFLRTGVRGKSAVALARELLCARGGLAGLLGARAAELRAPGLGPAKRAQLVAVLELVRRCLAQELRCGAALGSPGAVREYLRMLLADRTHEVFVCLWLDAQHRVLKCEELFRGTLTHTRVYPREVVKAALAANAAAVIFAHNHPSGVAQPSQADELLTRSLKEALALVEVKVLDHFIVAGGNSLSFAERGLL